MAEATNVPKNPIALVGLMGAGKSTIGRRLAKRLNLPFVDSDREIESTAGLSVAQIFERYGEERFREEERQVLARFVGGGPRVIATGGGAFIDEQIRALMLKHCTTIWLDVEIDTLAERARRRSGRPLLNGKDARAILQRLAATRNPIYAEAHIVIRGGDADHDTTVGRILKALGPA